MRNKQLMIAILCSTFLGARPAYGIQAFPAEPFSATESAAASAGVLTTNAQEGGRYSDGTRAINESRWPDAVAIFAKVASEPGKHSDGALYWKAYAENKQGKSGAALNTCNDLRRNYPKSPWIEECGALEIEIHAQSGQTIQPQAEQDSELKLLALNSLMKQDEPRALPEIQRILHGDLPEKVKERALFILAQGQSKQAQELMSQIAQEQSNPPLQAKAAAMLVGRSGNQAVAPGQNSAPPSSVQSEPAASSPARSLPLPGSANRKITLVVQVDNKLGKAIRGLQEQDFTVLDDKQAQKIVAFQAINSEAPAAMDPPVEIVLVVDAVNARFRGIGYERDEIRKFLLQNGGKLPRPVSLVMFTETETKINGASLDGNAVAQALDQYETGLRSADVTHGGFYSAIERINMSTTALLSIAEYAKKKPGRKLVIWMGPGWPMFGPQYNNLTSKTAQYLFDLAVQMSTELRQAHVTLYSIDPRGVNEAGELRNRWYENFLKGAKSPSQVLPGSLGLQVLAIQSGGRVFNSSNDLTQAIADSFADAEAYYVLSFDSLPADHADEYHALEVKVDKPGLTARTNTGYYDQR